MGRRRRRRARERLGRGAFRYIRLREPPYTDDDLRNVAARLRPPAYVYFRHEDEATAPDYAARLRELLSPSSE